MRDVWAYREASFGRHRGDIAVTPPWPTLFRLQRAAGGCIKNVPSSLIWGWPDGLGEIEATGFEGLRLLSYDCLTSWPRATPVANVLPKLSWNTCAPTRFSIPNPYSTCPGAYPVRGETSPRMYVEDAMQARAPRPT